MIAASCVHCGQRMTITEEAGNKKATCPKCGHVVAVPVGESGVRPARKLRRNGGERKTPEPARRSPDEVLEATRLTPAPPASHPGAETRTGVTPAIHEMPTRIEHGGPVGDAVLTAMLAPAETSDEIGRLGPYRVLGVIGAGGMGVVFRAHDPSLDRVVAVKAMLPGLAASAVSRKRFLREARAAAAIQHDRIVPIYQVGEDRGVPWLAMPLLRGESLDVRLQRSGGRLPAREVVRIAWEVAEGLAAIHELGLIHRDIKPANLFLEGAAGRVKILDFGLARAAGGDVQLTQEGSIVGSPAFMAPEQASRQEPDARVDLFSLGCVMYLAATGELPFEGQDALTTLVAVTTAEPIPPRQRNAEIPAELSALILRLLAKKPQDRPPSARDVAEMLARLEGEECGCR